MKTIMIDMDNVITDGMFHKYIEQFYHKKVDSSHVKSYYYVQELTKDRKEEFWQYVSDKNFYLNAPLLEGCYEVLERLNKEYDIYIVTSYLWKETIDLSGSNLKNKYYYLKEMLPFIKPEKYIFTTNKNIMNFDIRIDDKINNLDGSDIKLLFSAWHNRDISKEELKKRNVVRVDSWYDIGKILLSDDKKIVLDGEFTDVL